MGEIGLGVYTTSNDIDDALGMDFGFEDESEIVPKSITNRCKSVILKEKTTSSRNVP